jgi:menaquinol-cytochrome c reductase cytochrome b/c subunit
MAESPDEIFERVLKEEQEKGSSPPVAQARAKAARLRAQKGLPTDPTEAAKAASEAAGQQPAAVAPAEQPAAEAPAPQPEPEPARPAAEEAPAEESAAQAPEPAAAPSGDGAGGDGAAQREPATVGTPPAAQAAAPRGRGAAARAARATQVGASPERLQRLLAVVKPEAIQRVEREPIDRVNVWPHLMAAEFLSLLVITLALTVFSAFIDAPFRELANINQTPNPSKAPWYFLGLQELLRYFHPSVAGVSIPQWLILGFFAAPYIDRNPSTKPDDRKLAIVLFSIYLLFFAVLVIAGSFFRGPGFNWVYPWDIPVGTIFEL